jgi:hypothetical protein
MGSAVPQCRSALPECQRKQGGENVNKEQEQFVPCGETSNSK